MLGARLNSVRNYIGLHRDAGTLDIGPSDLVVDIGSGQSPHPRANVLVDRFGFDNSERACHAPISVDRPLVVADAAQTPFPDRTFDFSFCSHLLEHLPNPAAVLEEIQRIAKRGYIETPSPTYEKLWGWPFHRWYVSVEAGTLVFEPKPRPIFDPELHLWFSSQMKEPPFQRLVLGNLRSMGLLTVHVWEGTLAYEIRGDLADAHSEESAHAGVTDDARPDPLEIAHRARQSQTRAMRLKSVTDRRIRRRSDERTRQVLDQLQCVRCRENLDLIPGGLACRRCLTTFSATEEVLVMVPPGESR